MIKKFLLISLMCLAMVGCCSSDQNADKRPKERFTRYPAGDCFYYLIDEDTNIVYLSYAAGTAYGITELYDKDGSLMTADKLGLRGNE